MDQPLHAYMRVGLLADRSMPSRDALSVVTHSVETVASDSFFDAIEIPIPEFGAGRHLSHLTADDRVVVICRPRAGDAPDLADDSLATRTLAIERHQRFLSASRDAGAMRFNVSAALDSEAAASGSSAEALVESLYVLARYARSIGGPAVALAPRARAEGLAVPDATIAEAIDLVSLVRDVYPEVSLTLDLALLAGSDDRAGLLEHAAPHLGQICLCVDVFAGRRSPGGSHMTGVAGLADIFLDLFRARILATGRRPLLVFYADDPRATLGKLMIATKAILRESWARA